MVFKRFLNDPNFWNKLKIVEIVRGYTRSRERWGGIQGGDTQRAYAASNERTETHESNIKIFALSGCFVSDSFLTFPCGELVTHGSRWSVTRSRNHSCSRIVPPTVSTKAQQKFMKSGKGKKERNVIKTNSEFSFVCWEI